MPEVDIIPSPDIQEIEFGGPQYREVIAWRDLILRRPLGMVLRPADTMGEETQRHFVLREAGEILAGVIAVDAGAGIARLRQMWVRDDISGGGMGRALLCGVESILKDEGTKTIILHARLFVRGFYEKCGYVADGELFEEVGIPHIRMKRSLPAD